MLRVDFIIANDLNFNPPEDNELSSLTFDNIENLNQLFKSTPDGKSTAEKALLKHNDMLSNINEMATVPPHIDDDYSDVRITFELASNACEEDKQSNIFLLKRDVFEASINNNKFTPILS